jgi:hypothetical protein
MLVKKAIHLLLDRASLTRKELLTLHASGHAVTVGGKWEAVGEKSCQSRSPERLPGI